MDLASFSELEFKLPLFKELTCFYIQDSVVLHEFQLFILFFFKMMANITKRQGFSSLNYSISGGPLLNKSLLPFSQKYGNCSTPIFKSLGMFTACQFLTHFRFRVFEPHLDHLWFDCSAIKQIALQSDLVVVSHQKEPTRQMVPNRLSLCQCSRTFGGSPLPFGLNQYASSHNPLCHNAFHAAAPVYSGASTPCGAHKEKRASLLWAARCGN